MWRFDNFYLGYATKNSVIACYLDSEGLNCEDNAGIIKMAVVVDAKIEVGIGIKGSTIKASWKEMGLVGMKCDTEFFKSAVGKADW